MNAQLSPRRGAAERVTGAIWGAIVTAIGGLTIASLSGYHVDLELFAIIALAVLGVWLLFSALASATRASRRERERAEAVAGPAPVMQDGPSEEAPAPVDAPAVDAEPQADAEPTPGTEPAPGTAGDPGQERPRD